MCAMLTSLPRTVVCPSLRGSQGALTVSLLGRPGLIQQVPKRGDRRSQSDLSAAARSADFHILGRFLTGLILTGVGTDD